MIPYLCPFPLLLCLDLHVLLFQVARAGRFGTKGLAITFVSDENDAKVLNDVQDRFEVNITGLPEEIDISSYSKSSNATVTPLHFIVYLLFNTYTAFPVEGR